jgi:hypothetical protein
MMIIAAATPISFRRTSLLPRGVAFSSIMTQT